MRHVVIMDDSPELLEAIAFALRHQKVETIGVSCKQSLLTALQNNSAALVLMDVKLDRVDGRELCKELKSSQEFMHVPVILMSANPHWLQGYEDFRADDILEKPFRLDNMLEKVGRFLN